MKWFKCITPSSPAVLAAVRVLDKHGAFECLCAVAEALAQKVAELDVDMVKSWASIKRDRAVKILPFAQEILNECLKIPSKNTENVAKTPKNPPKISGNVPEISEQSSNNLVDFDPLKPRGSNNITNITSNKTDKETTQTSVCVVQNFSEFARQCKQYLIDQNNPNFTSVDWVAPYMDIQLPSVLENFGLEGVHVIECWMGAVDSAISAGGYSPTWIKKAFFGNLKKFDKSKHQVRPAARQVITRPEDILAADLVWDKTTGNCYRGSELEYEAGKGGVEPCFYVKETQERLDYRFVQIADQSAMAEQAEVSA